MNLERYRFGEFELEVGRRRLSRDGVAVAVPARAFAILVALLRRAGEVVAKDDLHREAWPDTFVTEASLAKCVSDLRKALGDSSTTPRYLATVPRQGYCFAAPVEKLGAAKRSTDRATAAAGRRAAVLVLVSALATHGHGEPRAETERREPPSAELKQRLAAPPLSEPTVEVPLGLARLLAHEGRLRESGRMARMALAAAREEEDVRGQSEALMLLARCLQEAGRPGRAKERLEEALSLAVRSGDPVRARIVGDALTRLAADAGLVASEVSASRARSLPSH